MSDGVKSFRVMLRHSVTEEIREYTLPVDGPQLIADLIETIPEMDPSRRVKYDGAFAGSLAAAIHGGTAGYVGEFLEIRKLDGPPPLTIVGELAPIAEDDGGCSATDPARMCADCQEGYRKAVEAGRVPSPEMVEDDTAEHEIGCTCLFCIPGQ